MHYYKISYSTHIFVFLVSILLIVSKAYANDDYSFYPNIHGPQETIAYDPAKWSYAKKDDIQLAQFRGKLDKRVLRDAGDELLVDLNVAYGRFFSPSLEGYQGFGYFTAKVDTDNRIRFNSSLGHVFPWVDGELFFTYRLLGVNNGMSLPNLGAIEDKVYENSFSANFTRYSNTFIRETSFVYSASAIPGQDLARSVMNIDMEDTSWYETDVLGGYSDTFTHKIAANIAFGSENLNSLFITGFKTSLGFGYDYVAHDQYHDQPGQIKESLSALATLQQQTSLGLIKTSYKQLQSSRTLTVGYSISGIELYAKDMQYQDQAGTQLFGFSLKFDLNNFGNLFRKKKKRLFGKAASSYSSYKSLDKIRHQASLNSDQFTTQPKLRESIGS